MADDDIVERCAAVCDGIIAELKAMKPKSRQSQYDRQSPLQIDYAIRAVKRAADRIRALKGVSAPPGGSDQSR